MIIKNHIINWIKVTIMEAIEFDGALWGLRALKPMSNKELRKISKFANKMSKNTCESRTDIVRHLYGFIAYPDMFEKEIKRLKEEVKAHDEN